MGMKDGMILSTVPGMLVLAGSGVRVVSSFSSAIFADLAMRGFPISFLTRARVLSLDSFLSFLCRIQPSCVRNGAAAVSFRTVTK